MVRQAIFMLAMLSVAACSNYEPREKVATYDPATGNLAMPYPCPDWSQTQTHNYMNQPHSSYGCAVNTNSAVQVAEPSDLYRGHGDAGPDIETTTRVVQRYRAGEIPVALQPQQGSTGGATQ